MSADADVATHRTATTLLDNLLGMAYRCGGESGRPMQFVSAGGVELTGYSADDVDPDSFGRLIHPDDRAMVDAAVDAALRDGVSYDLTYRIVSADGRVTWVRDLGRLITADDGTTRWFEGFASDVTERIRAQRLLEHRLEALTRITASQTFDQPMEATLDSLAESVVDVTQSVACVVAMIDEEHGNSTYRVVGIHGMPAEYAAAVEAAYRAGAQLSSVETYRTRLPVQRTIRGFMATDPHQTRVYDILRNADWDTIVSVPLLYRDRALGSLSCSYPIGREPDPAEIGFLVAIAAQAAIVLQTARLFAEVQDKAALEERQLLARELHDSVSQALFGIGLGARTARTLLDRDPAQAAKPLDFVVTLAEAGLTEMRALIFQLRPDALETEGLVRLLEQQAAALRTRHSLVVATDLAAEPAASPAIKEMLYRIAQEALHNVAKHAQARSVTLRLRQLPETLLLEIADDGVGFDPDGSFPGHLGLRSMRERAAQQGATVEIESAPGLGARTLVTVPISA